MGAVNEAYLEITERVINTFQLPEESFDSVQEIIIDRKFPLNDFEIVRKYFQEINIRLCFKKEYNPVVILNKSDTLKFKKFFEAKKV